MRLPILVFLLLVLLGAARADNRGGSSFSRYGIGDIVPVYNVRDLGMAGAGLALSVPNEIDFTNPAGSAHIARTLISVFGAYEGYAASDALTSNYLSRTSFGGAALALPIAPSSGVTFVMGLVPVSRVNYDIVLPDTLGDAGYSLEYLGEGGISRAFFSTTAVPATDLHLGVRLDYNFGTITHTIRQTFPTADYTSSEVARSSRHGGIGLSFGGIYSGLGKLFSIGEKSSLSIGGAVSTNSWLTTTNERRFSYNTGNLITKDTASLPDGTVKIPLGYAIGLAFESPQWTVVADYGHQNWADMTVDGLPAVNVRNGDRFSIGGELIPKRDPAAPFTQRWAYRLGFFYDASYYQLGATSLNEVGVSAGFGIPITSETRLNIATSYSFRGTTDNGLQKDRILRISFGITVGELWFVRREEE